MFALGLCLGIIAYAAEGSLARVLSVVSQCVRKPIAYLAAGGVLIGCLWILYAVFRPEVFLLGDGYEVIDQLAREDTPVKAHQSGAVRINLIAMHLLGLRGLDGAQAAIQFVAVAIGSLAMLACLLIAPRLFRDRAVGLVFVTGLFLGGYSLQFVGYVENYAAFIALVILFTLLGTYVTREPGKRWWLLPVAAGAAIMHILAVTLVPALLYALFAPTAIGRRIARMSAGAMLLAVLITGGVATLVLHVVASANFFAHYSLVPLVAEYFTPDRYSLFSSAHLLDVANLLLLVCPPLLLVGGLVAVDRRHVKLADPATMFLSLASLSTVGTMFLLDPKLGMARDWDLFSFAGVPLVALVFYVLVEKREHPVVRQSLMLALVLCLLTILPRIVTLSSVEQSVTQFRHYAMLDLQKNRKSWGFHLARHYEITGDTAQADAVRAEWTRLHPDKTLVEEARLMKQRGQWQRSEELLWQAAQINPSNSDIWSNLGEIVLYMGLVDSAEVLLTRCLRLNPSDYSAYNNLATAFLQWGQYDKAIKHLQRAHELYPEGSEILYNLATAHRLTGDQASYRRCLFMAVQRQPQIPQALYEIILIHVREGRIQEARRTLQRAAQVGLDGQLVEDLVRQVPQLGNQKN
jgi:Flp pilus assembly protein TadD